MLVIMCEIELFRMNNRYLQRTINNNFSECFDVSWMALNIIYLIVEQTNINFFNQYKENFIPFTFPSIEIDSEYTIIKNDLNLDVHKYIRDIIICNELNKINKNKTATIIYCKLLNDLFRNKYDEKLLKYMKETIIKLRPEK